MDPKEVDTPDISPEPSLLSHTKAAFSEAKSKRARFWKLEITASGLALVSAFMPIPAVGAVLSVGGIAAKIAAKLTSSSARSIFRQAERARRYDFQNRTLGWLVPTQAHADLLLSFSPKIEEQARKLASADSDYYNIKGEASTNRLYANLAESVFWTEKLMAVMANKRSKQLFWAIIVVLLTLVGLLLIQPVGLLSTNYTNQTVLLGLKLVGAFVSILVALDVYGEHSSFRRGASECRDIFITLENAYRAATPSRDEAIRLLIEYNCLLADLPMVPDEVHKANKDRLSKLWTTVSARLPTLNN